MTKAVDLVSVLHSLLYMHFCCKAFNKNIQYDVLQAKPDIPDIFNVSENNFQSTVTDKLKEMNISVTDVSIKRYDSGIYDYIFHIEMEEGIKEESLLSLFDYECSIDFAN